MATTTAGEELDPESSPGRQHRHQTTPAKQKRQPLIYLCISLILDLCFPSVEGTNWHHYHHHPRPQPGSIILGNRGLKVPRGSWAYLDPLCDLVTRVLPGDSCYVTVFDYDRAVIPGTLTPKKFPCAFEKGQVKYMHFGSKVITRDTVRLQVRYDTQTDTLVIPLTLEVEATANGREVVTTNTPLVVSELDGISSAINSQSLGIPFSAAGSSGSASRCKLTLLIGTGGFPRHGTLLNYVTNGQPTDCHAFLNMDVRYKLTATSDAPHIDYIPMLAELLDQHGRATQQEYFLITVRFALFVFSNFVFGYYIEDRVLCREYDIL